MAAGEYVSVSSQRDTEDADLRLEERELAGDPEGELAELAGIYEAPRPLPGAGRRGRRRALRPRRARSPRPRRARPARGPPRPPAAGRRRLRPLLRRRRDPAAAGDRRLRLLRPGSSPASSSPCSRSPASGRSGRGSAAPRELPARRPRRLLGRGRDGRHLGDRRPGRLGRLNQPLGRGRCWRSPGSGCGSESPASAARPPTSPCCAASWSSAGMDGRPLLRGRQRRLPALAGPVLDPAGDLLRLPGRRLAGSDRRRPLLRRPGGRPRHRPLPPLPLRRPRRSGSAAPAPGRVRRSPRSPPAPASTCSARASPTLARTAATRARWCAYLAVGARRSGPGRALPRPRTARLRRRSSGRAPRRARSPPASPRPPLAAPRGGRERRRRRPLLDGAQGRRPLLRRRLRDRAADAGRRRPHLPLDDNAEFLNAVALGQVTPGPVVATSPPSATPPSGSAARLLAALVAFLPSFSFVLLAGGRFERLRASDSARAFLGGAGPAAIGAILGSTIPLAGALTEAWQFAVLAAAARALLVLRVGVVPTLLAPAPSASSWRSPALPFRPKRRRRYSGRRHLTW